MSRFGPECREIPVELLLQFKIENDAEILASLVEDSPRLFVIKPVDVRVVVRFLRLDEAVIRGLAIGSKAVCAEQSVPFFRQGQHLATARFRSFKCLLPDEALLREIPNVVVHFFPMILIGMCREVFGGDHTELPQLDEGMFFRLAQAVRAIPPVKHGARVLGPRTVRASVAWGLSVPIDLRVSAWAVAWLGVLRFRFRSSPTGGRFVRSNIFKFTGREITGHFSALHPPSEAVPASGPP